FLGNRGDRRGLFKVRARNARSRDDHLPDFGRFILRSGLLTARILGEGGRSKQCGGEKAACQRGGIAEAITE
ncbi:MAG TPA: hypothetical protein VNC50_14570, partial [Planctomycetia bacterium]|nr:hypothetical protein [Planctomycetia bacterium]